MKELKKIIKNSFLYKPLKRGQSFFVSLKIKKNLKKMRFGKTVQMPDTVVFEPTIKCNLDCKMCYQKNERGLGKKDLSLDEIKEIFLKLKKSNKNFKNVSLIGAEIFMRSDLVEIIEFLGSLSLQVYLATNGTLINEKKVEQLKNLKNITGIGYSLDGIGDDHNKIRGRDYAFGRLIKAIELTKDYFCITVNSVVMDENIDRIYEIGEFLKKIGVTNYALQFEMSSKEREVKSSAKLLGITKNDLLVETKEVDGYSFSEEKIKNIIGRLRSILGSNVFIQPSVFEKFPEEYLEGSLREKRKLFCKDINSLRINARGEVIFCPFIKKSFGNLLEDSFLDIWDGDDLKKFRQRLLKSNLVPVCKRCCRLGSCG